MCPTCHTTLDQSDSPAARRIEAFIQQRIDQCATADEIEVGARRELRRRRFSRRRRARASTCSRGGCRSAACSPGRRVLGLGVWRWSRRTAPTSRRRPAGSGARRGRGAPARRAAGPARLMGARLAVSFAAGFASVITPCVLPLVPGYLVGALERRGRAARRAREHPPRARVEHAVHPRLHGRLRRARRGRRGDRRRPLGDGPDRRRRLRPRRARARVRRAAARAGARAGPGPARRARAAAARARCSAARSRSAPRRASARVLAAVLVLASTAGRC